MAASLAVFGGNARMAASALAVPVVSLTVLAESGSPDRKTHTPRFLRKGPLPRTGRRTI